MAEKATPKLTFREVTKKTWPDMKALFDAPGGPKYCWCHAFRDREEFGKDASSDERKILMERRIKEGTPVGILAYRDGEPVGWCSIAPRDTYSGLGVKDDDAGETVWSLVCFFVPRKQRKQGIFGGLLDAAVKHAKKRGATVVEAYPVDPDSPSYRFMGFVGSFAEAGFKEVGTVGTRRHVMRKKVGR